MLRSKSHNLFSLQKHVIELVFAETCHRLSILTSLFKAAVAVPRLSGSIERRVSIRGRDEDGKSLKVSAIQHLYGCCGLKSVAFGNLDFFQYSSDGEPHNLKILWSCST